MKVPVTGRKGKMKGGEEGQKEGGGRKGRRPKLRFNGSGRERGGVTVARFT